MDLGLYIDADGSLCCGFIEDDAQQVLCNFTKEDEEEEEREEEERRRREEEEEYEERRRRRREAEEDEEEEENNNDHSDSSSFTSDCKDTNDFQCKEKEGSSSRAKKIVGFIAGTGLLAAGIFVAKKFLKR